MRLDKKVAIVTGAASGIGLAIARALAKEGARVLLSDRHASRLDEAVAGIRAAGGEASQMLGDISDQRHAEGLVDAALARFGAFHVLCNNAGVMDYMQGIGELADDVWRRVLAINLDGPMYTMRRAVRHMLGSGGGSIINIASTAAAHGGAAGAAYTASKHALLGLSRNTAWMYAKRGIRCNTILPGGTRTNIAESMPPERLDPTGARRAGEFAGLIPEFLVPEDIGSIAVLLASDESVRINGAEIAADAGWSAV